MQQQIQVYTSYWAQLNKVIANELEPLAISRGKPRWFKGESVEELFPTWEMIKNVDGLSDADWEEQYIIKNLQDLDPKEMAEKLDGKVILCWEKPSDYCHRQTVGRWLEKLEGVTVTELIFS